MVLQIEQLTQRGYMLCFQLRWLQNDCRLLLRFLRLLRLLFECLECYYHRLSGDIWLISYSNTVSHEFVSWLPILFWLFATVLAGEISVVVIIGKSVFNSLMLFILFLFLSSWMTVFTQVRSSLDTVSGPVSDGTGICFEKSIVSLLGYQSHNRGT